MPTYIAFVRKEEAKRRNIRISDINGVWQLSRFGDHYSFRTTDRSEETLAEIEKLRSDERYEVITVSGN